MSSQWFAMRQQKKVSFPPGSINYMLDQMRERQTRSPLTQFARTCTYKTPATLPSIIVSIYTLQLKSVYKRRICLVSSLQYTHTSLSFFMLDNHLTYTPPISLLWSPPNLISICNWTSCTITLKLWWCAIWGDHHCPVHAFRDNLTSWESMYNEAGLVSEQ